MNIRTLNKVSTIYIELPASKSISNRLLLLNALLGYKLTLLNLSEADDTSIMRKMLAPNFNASDMDVKNAGTCFRFLLAYNALNSKEMVLKGNEEMNKRPIKILVDALRELGAEIYYLERQGFPPLRIVGKKLKGGELLVSGSVSSQYLSALCMIGPFLEEGLELNVKDELKSASYLDMTVAIMQEMGFDISRKENSINILPFNQLKKKTYYVEADWSSASYWYCYISFCELGERLFLPGLSEKSLQGDCIIVSLFASFGVESKFEREGVWISKTGRSSIQEFIYDFSSIPDIVQTMVITCIGNNIRGVFNGISHLKYKETNRIASLQKEVKKLGAEIILNNEDSFTLIIREKLPLKAFIETYQDHRMALAFAPLVKKGIEVTIENPHVVEKSYPGFWNYFE